MKKKTEFQNFVCSVQPKLKPITPTVLNWGFKNCFTRRGIIRRKTAHCLECGHSWKPAGDIEKLFKKCTCPECGEKLQMEQEPGKLRNSEAAYYDVITTVGALQVVRVMLLRQFCKVGAAATYDSTEVMQHFINDKAETVIFSMKANGLSYSADQWIWSSKLEYTDSQSSRALYRASIGGYKTYPKQKVIPIITRNGYSGEMYGSAAQVLFIALLTDPKIETLVKAGQASILENWRKVRNRWESIKICLRNGYIVQDASIWADYLDLLQRYKKDLLNSFFVCPVDLHAAHNLLMNRRNKELERERRLQEYRRRIEQQETEAARQEAQQRKIELLQVYNEKYQQQKSKFFGISITSGNYSIQVLKTVDEFKAESDALKICLFSNEYYKKSDSLILSARIEGKPVEAIEISLSDLRVVQCRGWDNKPTEHHKNILRLVNQNLHQIRKAAK